MAYVQKQDEEEDGMQSSSSAIQGREAPTAGTGQPSAGMGGQVPGQNSGDYTRSKFVSARKLIDKNIGSGQADLTQPYRQKIAQESEGIKSSFGQYQKGLGEQEQAAKGIAQSAGQSTQDDSQFSKVLSFLKSPADVQSFAVPRETQDFSGLQALGTQSGLRSAMKDTAKQQGVAKYGRGMSALDAATFAADPTARQKISESNVALADLRKQREEIAKQSEAAREETTKRVAESQQAARQGLQGRAADVRSAAAQRAAQADFSGEARKLRDQAVRENQLVKDMMEAAKAEKDPETRKSMQSQLDTLLKTDLPRLYGAGGMGASELFNEGEASEFNRIMEALGAQDRVQAQTARDVQQGGLQKGGEKQLEDIYNRFMRTPEAVAKKQAEKSAASQRKSDEQVKQKRRDETAQQQAAKQRDMSGKDAFAKMAGVSPNDPRIKRRSNGEYYLGK